MSFKEKLNDNVKAEFSADRVKQRLIRRLISRVIGLVIGIGILAFFYFVVLRGIIG